jgi:hypothetical protein
MSDISRFTPGVETPGGGGRRGRCFLALSADCALWAGGSCAHNGAMHRASAKPAKRGLVICYFLSFRQSGGHAARIDAQKRAPMKIAEPQGVKRELHSATARSPKLLDHFFARDINASEREAVESDPDRPAADRDTAAS